MKTAITVIATVILTSIAILASEQTGLLKMWSGLGKTCSPSGCAAGPDGRSCATPRATTVSNWAQVISFGFPTGDAQGCVSQTSTCDNGVWLSGIAPLQYNHCEIVSWKKCVVWDTEIIDGSTMRFYNEGAMVNNQRVCTSQQRACDNGEISGDEIYTYTSCEPREPKVVTGDDKTKAQAILDQQQPTQPTGAAPKASTPTTSQTTQQNYSTEDKPYNCPSPRWGSQWENGRTASVYLQSSVLEWQTCESTSVVCAYGSIRYGTPDAIGEPVQWKVYSSCSTRSPNGCTSLCWTVGNGETLTTRSANGVAYSAPNGCEGAKIFSICNDGTLSPAAGNYCSCNVLAPASCTAPNGTVINHNGSLTLYQDAEVQAQPGDGTDSCVRQRRSCNDGTRYDTNNVPSPFTYTHSTCTVLPPS